MARSTDAELVEAARGGDVSSFGELYRRHYAGMVGIAYSILADHHLAEDAAQEAFAVACRDLGRLKRPTRFGNWLRAICRNVARNTARLRPSLADPRDVPAPLPGNPRDDVDELVWRCVDRLPPSEREVVVLRYFSGLTYEQIAAMLGISREGVRGRLKRGRQRMAERLKRTDLGRRMA